MTKSWLADADPASSWAHQAWPAFQQRSGFGAILPVFGFADHGLGLSLDIEEVVGSDLLRHALGQMNGSPWLVLPPLRFGLAPYSAQFLGLDADTAYAHLLEIARGVKAAGALKLAFFVTSPWQTEWVQTVAVDARVELDLSTYVISFAGLGLSLHPASDQRVRLQALGCHLLQQAPGPRRPGVTVEPDFRPGRWEQPPPVEPAPGLDPTTERSAVSQHLAQLLTEIAGHPGVTGALASAAGAQVPRPVESTAPWPPYRSRYLPALRRDELDALSDKTRALLILPTASIEQHGHHLPVGVDTILGQAWLHHALQHLPANAPVWVLPPVHFGKSNEHLGFPGTVSVSTTTLRGVIAAVARQVHSLGFRQLAIFNTHGGNTAVLIYTLRELQVSLGLRLGMLQNPYRPALSPDEATFGFHAGDWETSLMLAAAPETVRMDHAVNELPARLADPGELRPEAAPATFAWMSRDISQSGVMGDATAATPAKGQRWLAESSRSLADRIIQLVNTT